MRVTIDSLAHGGDAIARLDDGRVAFVRGGCPGDLAQVEVVRDHRRHVEARILTVLEPSPDRVEAPCPYFGECGGCQWQHVSDAAQRHAKRRIVADSLSRIARLDVDVAHTVTSSAAYGYRNKIELVVGGSGRDLSLGYHRLGEATLVPVESCLLLPRGSRRAPRSLTGALRYLAGRHGDLGLRRVALRTSTETGDVEVALWTEPGSFPRRIVARALSDAVGAGGVVRVLTKGPDKERRVTGVEALSGRGAWRETLAGRKLLVSAPSFFQVNTASAETLVESVLHELAPGPRDRLLDLYAGVGTFTLPAASRSGEVVAVEASRHALADLRRNLERTGLDADVVGGDATRELPALGTFDLAIVDPPRSGLDADAITALSSAGPRKIAYVSCDPATLARDAARLSAHGYALVSVTPHDLFPQTYHVESAAIFERTG